jgi:hypothetical protein
MKIEDKIKELEKQIESLKREAQKQTQKEGEMEQRFKSLLNGLRIEIDDKRPDSVYYIKSGRILFELYQDPNNKKEKHFWCNTILVWSVFEDEYNLNYDETQVFIKNMVEKYLKLEAVIPDNSLHAIY